MFAHIIVNFLYVFLNLNETRSSKLFRFPVSSNFSTQDLIMSGKYVTMWSKSLIQVFWILVAVLPPPTGAAGGGEETLWELRAPAWRAVVYWIQTHSQLAEEDWRDPGSCGCQDQEHLLMSNNLYFCIFCN